MSTHRFIVSSFSFVWSLIVVKGAALGGTIVTVNSDGYVSSITEMTIVGQKYDVTIHYNTSFNALFGTGEPPIIKIPQWYTPVDSQQDLITNEINTFLTTEGIAGTHVTGAFSFYVPYQHTDPGQRETFFEAGRFEQTAAQAPTGDWSGGLNSLRRDGGFGHISFIRPDLGIATFALSAPTAVPEPSTAIAMGLLGVVGFAGNRRRRRQVSAA